MSDDWIWGDRLDIWGDGKRKLDVFGDEERDEEDE